MKKQLLFVICLVLELNFCFGQASTDVQWLIRDNKGKDGMAGALNTFNFNIGTSSQYSLNGINFPNKAIDSRSKKEFFAIYSDGSHFNSRGGTFSFNNQDGSTNTSTTHNFSVPAAISYMYISTIYEEDDYPPAVSVSGFSTSGTGPYNMTLTTSPSRLYANHEVVFDKDITLIINLSDIIAQHAVRSTDVLKLTFNQVEDISHSHHIIPNLDIFDVSNAFYDLGTTNYTHSFPIGSTRLSSSSTEEIILDMSKNQEQQQYIYINLKPNINAESYAPIGTNIYNAVFQITKNGVMVEELREEIRHSHDPNFLRVDSIEKIDDGGHYVYYHLEFENNGTMFASGLKAQVTFQPMFDLTDLTPLNWFANGSIGGNGVSNRGSRDRIFDFGTATILPCPSGSAASTSGTNSTQCIGYVEFKVKTKPGFNVQDPDISLRLINPKVLMGGTWYDLNEFYDLVRIRKSFPFTAQLYRPTSADDGPDPCVPGWVWIIAIIAAILVLLVIIFRKRIFA